MNALPISAAGKIRVLIADNSRIHTQLLSDALERDADLDVVNWDGNLSTLVSAAADQDVDVLAIGSALNGRFSDSLDVVRELRRVSPATKAIILLDSHKKEDVINAFRAGARGIFSRDGSVEMFRKCMHRVHQGEIWADTRGISLAIDALNATPVLRAVGKNGVNLLSKRELEVVQCLAQGLTNREIAEKMELSQHTVKNYLFRVFDKLGVSSRIELLFMTLSQGNNSDDAMLYEVSKGVFQNRHDETAMALFEKAAKKGLPAAQLALAQLYAARQAQPDDLVQAYTWYLIATERASQAKEALQEMLTPQQLQEAQRRSSVCLNRMNQDPAQGMGRDTNMPPSRRPAKQNQEIRN
jgi:two-component system nitrate/nitrite response regulator NarL